MGATSVLDEESLSLEEPRRVPHRKKSAGSSHDEKTEDARRHRFFEMQDDVAEKMQALSEQSVHWKQHQWLLGPLVIREGNSSMRVQQAHKVRCITRASPLTSCPAYQIS